MSTKEPIQRVYRVMENSSYNSWTYYFLLAEEDDKFYRYSISAETWKEELGGLYNYQTFRVALYTSSLSEAIAFIVQTYIDKENHGAAEIWMKAI